MPLYIARYRLVTLPSGATLAIPHHLMLVSETTSLAHATPAVLSRCGVLVVEADLLSWQHMLSAWLAGVKAGGTAKEVVDFLWKTLASWIPALLRFLRIQVCVRCLVVWNIGVVDLVAVAAV